MSETLCVIIKCAFNCIHSCKVVGSCFFALRSSAARFLSFLSWADANRISRRNFNSPRRGPLEFYNLIFKVTLSRVKTSAFRVIDSRVHARSRHVKVFLRRGSLFAITARKFSPIGRTWRGQWWPRFVLVSDIAKLIISRKGLYVYFSTLSLD